MTQSMNPKCDFVPNHDCDHEVCFDIHVMGPLLEQAQKELGTEATVHNYLCHCHFIEMCKMGFISSEMSNLKEQIEDLTILASPNKARD